MLLFYLISVQLFSLILANNYDYHNYSFWHNENDTMGWHEKKKICDLSRDLLKDSLLKMRQIMVIREEHDKTVAYGIGMIMGRIREKYRYMLEAFRFIFVSHFYWLPKPPSVLKAFGKFEFIIALERMHFLQLEIDKLVDVIIEETAVDISKDRENAGEKGEMERINETKSTKTKKTKLRGGVERRLEEVEKSLMRQRYLMKKLGHPVNMSTKKKRFLRQWPVEGSWSLDKYNYNYK